MYWLAIAGFGFINMFTFTTLRNEALTDVQHFCVHVFQILVYKQIVFLIFVQFPTMENRHISKRMHQFLYRIVLLQNYEKF